TFTYGLAIDLTETPCQETVANDTQAQAEPYCAPWFGTIFPAGDADFVKVQPTSSGTMTVATSDFGDGACASNGVNTIVRIFDVNGTELTVDDDSGPGDCSLATRSVIGNAVYFVKVQAAPAASPVTFEYRLDITVP
ncbi:MAG: hypothetical protein ABI639_13115, partial [Thermoanaerobaculia bacterium]